MIVDFSLSKKIYPIFIHLKDRGTVFPKRRKTLLRTVRIFRSLIYPFFQVYKLFRSAINRLNINLQLQLRLLFGSWHIFTKNRFVISCHWPRFTQLIGTYLVLYHWIRDNLSRKARYLFHACSCFLRDMILCESIRLSHESSSCFTGVTRLRFQWSTIMTVLANRYARRE